MADKSSSTIAVRPPSRSPQNLIVFNVSAQALLKLTATNYITWQLQFTSLLFGYDLLGFVDGSKPCPPTMITLPNTDVLSPNPDHILWLQQDQLLLNAIIGSVSTTLVQFITSRDAWTTLEKTYASPLRGRIMVHH